MTKPITKEVAAKLTAIYGEIDKLKLAKNSLLRKPAEFEIVATINGTTILAFNTAKSASIGRSFMHVTAATPSPHAAILSALDFMIEERALWAERLGGENPL